MNGFVLLCHSIAVVAVRRKISLATLQKRILQEQHSDLAYDCIADLFRMDEVGTMVQVKAYFEGLDCEDASDEVLLAHLRRLVLSKVNQGIFRTFNEVDPTFGKILRNVKLAVQALQSFTVVERFGETCIYPANCDPLAHLPMAQRSDLERALREAANGGENIPTLLARLSLYLREQKVQSRIVPLLSVALIFKAVYENQPPVDAATTDVEEAMARKDVLAIVKQCCGKIKGDMQSSYVEKKKVSRRLYELYFEAIEQNLCERLAGTDDDNHSLYHALRSKQANLTRETYKKTHRARLEYLATLAYEETVKALKKENQQG